MGHWAIFILRGPPEACLSPPLSTRGSFNPTCVQEDARHFQLADAGGLLTELGPCRWAAWWEAPGCTALERSW